MDGLPSWPTDQKDVYLVPLPLNHIYGMLMVNECNITGTHLIINKWFDPNLVLESITENKVTHFVGVPDALYGEEVKVFVVLRAGFTVSAEELIGAGTAISS